MIVRRRKINPNSIDVSIHISLGQADIRQWVRNIIRSIFYDPNYTEIRKTWVYSEIELRNMLERNPLYLGTFEAPWCSQLSAWAFNRMIAYGYIAQSGNAKNGYYFTDKALRFIDYRKPR